MDIERIANNIDRDDNIVVLTLNEAINLLINKASKNSQNCFLMPSVKFNAIFDSFIDGKTNLTELRESSEELMNAATDIDALISAIVESPHAEPVQIGSNEIMPTSELEYKYMAYKLIDCIREWTDSNNHNNMLNEASKFVNMSYQLYRNIIILEKHLGGNFRLTPGKTENAAYAFDKLLLESVSTGAIAMRPAILGGERKISDVFPKKKRRWYLQYVVR